MTNKELYSNIASELKDKGIEVTPKLVRAIIDSYVEKVSGILEGDGSFTIQGIVRIDTRVRKGYQAMNPRTGEKFMTPEKKVLSFRPSKSLLDRINAQEK